MSRSVLIALVLIIIGSAAFLLFQKQSSGTLEEDETAFAIEDTDTNRMGKIFLGSTDGKRIILERENGVWMVNGRRKAKKDVIANLIRVMRKIEVKRPVSGKSRDEVIRLMSGKNTKVEIYDKEGELMKAYLVGFPSTKFEGNFMLVEGAENPYEVYYPGFKGFLSTYYTTEEKKWFSREIFDYKVSSIRSIKVEYPLEAEHGFEIKVDDKAALTFLDHQGSTVENSLLYLDRIQDYLGFFKHIHAEAIELDYTRKDSLLATSPFCRITITDIDGNVTPVEMYYRQVARDTKDVLDQINVQDVDRYLAYLRNEDMVMLIQGHIFGKLWRKAGEFMASP